MPGMILLEPYNRILEETAQNQINPEDKRENIDVRLCDFDDVSYHISVTAEKPDVMQVSMNMPCYHKISEKGGKTALEKYYGKYSGEVETGYDLSLHVPLVGTSEEGLARKLAMLKSNVTGGVFDYYFSALVDGKTPEKPFSVDLRSDTTVWFIPRDDRVIVIFGIDFTERVDKVVAKVFLQEFVDGRSKVGRAPPCAWGANPPAELQALGINDNRGTLGYISFAVLKSHVEQPKKKEAVITVLQSFRTFLQYHIKCSKSHFHSRMRKRCVELLKILNRAKVEDPTAQKKTAAGKTFTRA